jgi:arginyl-tRNA synthetase
VEITRETFKSAVREALAAMAGDSAASLPELGAETPPDPAMGDIGFPMFPFARVLRKSPQAIAAAVAAQVAQRGIPGTVEAAGPYVNVRLDRGAEAGGVLDRVEAAGPAYGSTTDLAGQRVTVEFSSPNTNKPLHLGHMRNDALGMSVSRLLEAAGAAVRRVNLVNDRGIHICKSMAAYEKFGQGRTPESEGIKSDHFVGDYYVRYDAWSKEGPAAEERAREMLRLWEKGDPAVTALWKQMNDWTIGGIEKTYRRTGVAFDQVYFESQTYELGRAEILKGLERGAFYRKDDGSVWVDLEAHGLDQKVLLRGDGTSLYVTQDIGTAMLRHRDWPFDRLVYVVGSEQNYHFQVLFRVLEILGNPWARNLYHLSYGMVNLPEGKMKSREGTVVDADNLLDELKELAAAEITDKGREKEIDDVDTTTEAVALGAVTYFLLQFTPGTSMVFNPRESISFNGNTGPYLQYTGARIASLQRKAGRLAGQFRVQLLMVPEEWELIKAVASLPDTVRIAARDYNPSVVTAYLYELARVFNKYYHDNSILNNDDADLVATRMRLCSAVGTVLRRGMHLLSMPYLEKM